MHTRETLARLVLMAMGALAQERLMIKHDARMTIRTLPLENIQIKEYQERYPDKLNLYIQLLKEHPREYAGLLFVTPSDTHPGMFILLDGHHKFCASIITGRPDALCVVIEEAAHT